MGKTVLKEVAIVEPSAVNWREYRELRLNALRNEPQAYLTSYENARKEPGKNWKGYLQAAVDGESWMMFARAGEVLIGMVGAYQSDEGKTKQQIEVIAMYVDPGHRGQKIGTRLLEKLLGILKDAGKKSAHLECSAEQIPAVALYQRLGFAEVGRRRLVLGDGKEHELVAMERLL